MAGVLIADADASLRAAFSLILRKRIGVSEVREAANLVQLQSRLERWQPDLILLDYRLPGLAEVGGLAKYRSVLSAPVIALSIRAEDGPAALLAGADEFIHKSFPPDRALAIIQSVRKG